MAGQRYAIDEEQISRIMGSLGAVDKLRDELTKDSVTKPFAERLNRAVDSIYEVIHTELKRAPI